ncbi:hypothetical protein [Treponema pectinovorum]|uniref:hypothetical protein n=1 Tax=Treponema pectinovorum TaxID=164 RepID=UPI0011F2945A|nr:hypothetical protein [Treponema pectinovorum]
MKRKYSKLLFLFIIFIGILFLSCKTDVDETYTVWTDKGTYSDFQQAFKATLNDGMYTRVEFTSSQWSQISPVLTSVGRHNWTQDKIKDWLIGSGFGNDEATRESAWLTTVNHGFIAARVSNIVYFILK